MIARVSVRTGAPRALRSRARGLVGARLRAVSCCAGDGLPRGRDLESDGNRGR